MTTPPATSSERPVALITGGTRGIGLAIAHDLATTHTVYIGGTSEESVKKAQETVPDAQPFVADLTDPSSVGKALEAFPEPALDVLVLSAGISVDGAIADVPREDWVRVLDLNVIAQVCLIRQLLPKLRATHGDIVAINSGSGHRSRPGSAPYCASKFALRAITDALREEERGVIRVTWSTQVASILICNAKSRQRKEWRPRTTTEPFMCSRNPSRPRCAQPSMPHPNARWKRSASGLLSRNAAGLH